MRIQDEKLLALFRLEGSCECCGKWFARREVHHVRSRGAGGSDIPENLLSVGPSDGFECRCHARLQTYSIPLLTAQKIIALREGKSLEEIQEKVFLVLRSTNPIDG